MNEQSLLRDFPLLNHQVNDLAYLDNGATTQKPESVIQAICGYYGGCNANPHRGAYALSVKATDIYENARAKTAKFIHAQRPEEIIFTKNATEALNLVAYSYGSGALAVRGPHQGSNPQVYLSGGGWQSLSGGYCHEDNRAHQDSGGHSGIKCAGAEE